MPGPQSPQLTKYSKSRFYPGMGEWDRCHLMWTWAPCYIGFPVYNDGYLLHPCKYCGFFYNFLRFLHSAENVSQQLFLKRIICWSLASSTYDLHRQIKEAYRLEFLFCPSIFNLLLFRRLHLACACMHSSVFPIEFTSKITELDPNLT